MALPLVLILYNHPVLPGDHPDAESEHTIVEIADDVAVVLEATGSYRTTLLGLKEDPTVLWSELRRRKPAVVFNLFEGSLANSETESYVAGLLEWRGIPFTGSPMQALSIARAKDLTKQLLRGAGLPTADFMVVSELPAPPCNLEWPVIVKPARQDASIGLAQDSVCTTQEQLDQRVQFIFETYGAPVLVEEFIPGREFNVALVDFCGLQYMPPAEIIFRQDRPGVWPILTYDGKWKPGSADYETTPPKFPADIPARLAHRLGTIAMEAYRLLGCRDYARVDFRVKPNGKPYILEINPNPEISPQAGFAGCLGSGQISHEEFIARLVEHALNRPQGHLPHFAMNQCLSLEPAS
jgi:D-alanine-D-alanine ligase